MAIQIAATRQVSADAYKNIASSGAPYVSLHKGSPGTTGANEASGGSPAYARKQTTWTSGSGGVLTGTSVTIDVPADSYTHAAIWKVASGGSPADLIDWVAITPTTLGAQGQIVVTPSFTQT